MFSFTHFSRRDDRNIKRRIHISPDLTLWVKEDLVHLVESDHGAVPLLDLLVCDLCCRNVMINTHINGWSAHLLGELLGVYNIAALVHDLISRHPGCLAGLHDVQLSNVIIFTDVVAKWCNLVDECSAVLARDDFGAQSWRGRQLWWFYSILSLGTSMATFIGKYQMSALNDTNQRFFTRISTQTNARERDNSRNMVRLKYSTI